MNQICEHHIVRHACKICVSKSSFRRFKKKIRAATDDADDKTGSGPAGALTMRPGDTLIMTVGLVAVGAAGDTGAIVLQGHKFEIPQLGTRGHCVAVGSLSKALRFRTAQTGNILVMHMQDDSELTLDVSQRLYEEVDSPVMLWAATRPELVCRWIIHEDGFVSPVPPNSTPSPLVLGVSETKSLILVDKQDTLRRQKFRIEANLDVHGDDSAGSGTAQQNTSSDEQNGHAAPDNPNTSSDGANGSSDGANGSTGNKLSQHASPNDGSVSPDGSTHGSN